MDLQGALVEHPHSVYERLRHTAPVSRIAGTDGLPAWLVTRYDDVRAALADPRLSVDKRNAAEGGYRGLALSPALHANLLNVCAPVVRVARCARSEERTLGAPMHTTWCASGRAG